MKRRIVHSIITVLLLGVLLLTLPQPAMAASASLSGSGSVQPGNTVTLTLSVSGSNVYGLTGKLTYGSNLSLTNYNCSVSGWSMEVNEGNFSAYGTSASSGGAILTVTLKVASDAAAGSDLSASFGGITVSDGEQSIALESASWSGKVSAPPSNNCDLKGITVTNATLSPAFNKNTTNYSCTVPYAVEKLALDYFRADSGQTVSVNGNGGFVVGENTVTLSVKAANGAGKTYTIVVTRGQDPNYKASNDAKLSELTVEGATLSPAFSPEVIEYIAYVPHETGAVKLTGVPRDEKAQQVTEGEANLMNDGATDVSVVCTAEDGKTTQTYTVHVYRMPAYTGGIPLIEYTNEQDIIPEDPTPMFNFPMVLSLPLVGEVSTVLVAVIAAAVILILLFVLGFLLGGVRRTDRWEEEEEEQADYPPEPVKIVPPAAAEPEEQKNEPMPLYREVVEEEPPVAPAEPEPEEISAEKMSLDQLLEDIHNME